MRKYLIAMAVLLLAFSCSRTIDHQLDTIEQEISSDPYAAYEQLSGLSKEQLRPSSRKARYALLMSLAMDKSYIDVTDDSLAQIAVMYYDRHGSEKDKMLSLYSLGRVQRNAGNNTGAIISFLEAKELAEKMEDKHYQALILKNIAEIYGDSNDYETELMLFRQSADIFLSIGEGYYAAYSALGEAMANIALDKVEKADSILTKLEAYARKNQHLDLLCSTLKNRALILSNPDRVSPEQVLSLFREVRELGYPASNTSDYGIIALAFELLNHRDSADYYLSLAEANAVTVLSSVHLSNSKFRILNHRGEIELANEQMNKGIELHNKLILSKSNFLIANTISEYRGREARHNAALAHYRLIMLVLSIVIALSLLIILVQQVVLHKQQIEEKERALKEKEEKIEEDLSRITEVTSSLQTIRQDCSDLARAVNIALQEKIAVVKMFADAYVAIHDEPKINPADPYRYLDDDYKKKEVSKLKSFEMALDSFRQDESLFSLLEDSVNRFRDNLMTRFYAACDASESGHHLFNETDYRMIMLFFAGVPDKTIAFLMNTTCGAVRTRKTRYKEKISRSLKPQGLFFLNAMSDSSFQ